jgi:hypothetical protein
LQQAETSDYLGIDSPFSAVVKGVGMGHTRLGTIPKSAKWSSIIAAIAGEGQYQDTAHDPSETVPQIAKEALQAAESGLEKAVDDVGLCFTFYLIIKVVLASRTKQWEKELKSLGINLAEQGGLFDLTSEVQARIDDHLHSHSCSTDIAEMAQQAAGEAFSQMAAVRQMMLFGSTRDQLRETIKAFSTKKNFSELSQKFFGLFLARYLNFFISRVTASEVGGKRLNQIGDLSKFNSTLKRHCEQSAQILSDFSGTWYSKANFEGGIDFAKTKGFIAVAIEKLRSELKQQRGEL